jgi:hypothetical protein
MATVVGMTAEAINAITGALVETGEVQDDGTIVLITLDGTRLPIGNIAVDPSLAEIANLAPADLDMIQSRAGVWTNRTMAQILADLGTDISTIEGLTPATSDILQYKAGAWANRTIAQLMLDIKADPHFAQAIIKTTATNRTSSTLSDDPDLKTTLDPNSTYDISLDMSYGGTAAMVWQFTCPSGTGGFYCLSCNIAGTGEITNTYTWTTGSNTAGAVTNGWKAGGYLTTGATGGNFAFKWGSATNGTTCQLGTSIMRVRKVSP